MLEYLRKGVAQLELPATEQQHALIQEWVRLLIKWNQKYNLTAQQNEIGIIRDLVLDSLYAAKHLRGETVIDVGSGAGVPGIPLAIYCPQKHFSLIDSTGKKARFMEQCRMDLGLDNVSVLKSRVQMFQPHYTFDTIISRAFGKLTEFINASRHLANDSSIWLTFKTKAYQAEWREWEKLADESARWQMRSYDYGPDDNTRTLVLVTRQQ